MKFVCLLVLVTVTAASIKRRQNVTVFGTAFCNGKAAKNIVVELKEKDYLTPDDSLANMQTNNEGEFEVFGEDNEVFDIAPYIVFHHSCNSKPSCPAGTSTYNVSPVAIGGFYNLTVDLATREAGDKQLC